jgi:hypothetical protein
MSLIKLHNWTLFFPETVENLNYMDGCLRWYTLYECRTSQSYFSRMYYPGNISTSNINDEFLSLHLLLLMCLTPVVWWNGQLDWWLARSTAKYGINALADWYNVYLDVRQVNGGASTRKHLLGSKQFYLADVPIHFLLVNHCCISIIFRVGG